MPLYTNTFPFVHSLSYLTVDTGLTADGTTLVVDAINHRVGIGTASPNAPIQVVNYLELGTGAFCTYLGLEAGMVAATNISNTAVGYRAVYASNGNNIVGLGYEACHTVVGDRNAGFGSFALEGCVGDDNVGLGHNAGYLLVGGDCLAIGNRALFNSTSSQCAAVGTRALFQSNTTYSVGIGYYACGGGVSSYDNIGIGAYACYRASKAENIGIGTYTLFNNSGLGDIAIGYNTFATAALSGDYNIGIGYDVGASLTSGSRNILLGKQVDVPSGNTSDYLSIGNLIYGRLATGRVGIGTNNPNNTFQVAGLFNDDPILANLFIGGNGTGGAITTGQVNIGIGDYCLAALQDGQENFAMGIGAMYVSVHAFSNLAIGIQALRNTEYNGVSFHGCYNVALGAYCLTTNTTGQFNVALGANSLYSNTSGYNNMAVGSEALLRNTTGYENIAIGTGAGQMITSGYYNVQIGGSSAAGVNTGYQNVTIGALAALTLTSGHDNIIIGFGADVPLGTTSNFLNIGSALYGDLSAKSFRIGSATPTARLHLAAGTASANSAPQKYDSGTLLTALEAGTREYNGNHFATNSAIRFSLGGSIFDHFADAGNVTTGETDLYSDTLLASTLAVNGDKVFAEYGGVYVNHATATRQIRAYFGGTLVFDSGALTVAVGADSWELEISVIRESSSVVRTIATLTDTGATATVVTNYTRITGLTLTNTQILKITGTAAGVGAATNDIVAKLGSLIFAPAAA